MQQTMLRGIRRTVEMLQVNPKNGKQNSYINQFE